MPLIKNWQDLENDPNSIFRASKAVSKIGLENMKSVNPSGTALSLSATSAGSKNDAFEFINGLKILTHYFVDINSVVKIALDVPRLDIPQKVKTDPREFYGPHTGEKTGRLFETPDEETLAYKTPRKVNFTGFSGSGRLKRGPLLASKNSSIMNIDHDLMHGGAESDHELDDDEVEFLKNLEEFYKSSPGTPSTAGMKKFNKAFKFDSDDLFSGLKKKQETPRKAHKTPPRSEFYDDPGSDFTEKTETSKKYNPFYRTSVPVIDALESGEDRRRKNKTKLKLSSTSANTVLHLLSKCIESTMKLQSFFISRVRPFMSTYDKLMVQEMSQCMENVVSEFKKSVDYIKKLNIELFNNDTYKNPFARLVMNLEESIQSLKNEVLKATVTYVPKVPQQITGAGRALPQNFSTSFHRKYLL